MTKIDKDIVMIDPFKHVDCNNPNIVIAGTRGKSKRLPRNIDETWTLKSKCWECLNSRIVTSEAGRHPVCCLSSKKAVECQTEQKDRSEYVKR